MGSVQHERATYDSYIFVYIIRVLLYAVVLYRNPRGIDEDLINPSGSRRYGPENNKVEQNIRTVHILT